MYHYCLTKTTFRANRDVMGVAWVVRDSLWNASSAPWDRREMSAESWAHRTLEVASIDMDYAPALLAAQVYNVRNAHWVLRLLLVSPTRTFLCLVFDLLSNRPYIVGANIEELAIVNLIAEQEGIEPRPVGQVFGWVWQCSFCYSPPLLHLPTSKGRCELPSRVPSDASLPFVQACCQRQHATSAR